MSDINIGDMLYDVEAEGNLIGWVTKKKGYSHWVIEWNDCSITNLHQEVVRDLKKEWYKLKRKCLTRKRK